MASVTTNSHAALASRYVTRDSSILQGEPTIANTEVAVRDIVVLWKAGVKPEEIPQHLFNLVTVAQVFDALSFYCDAAHEVDAWIDLYADYPFPLSRLNPLWDDFVQGVTEHRLAVDTELQG